MRGFRRPAAVAAVLLLLPLLVAAPASAQSTFCSEYGDAVIWTGEAGDGHLGNPANWAGGAPGPGDVACVQGEPEGVTLPAGQSLAVGSLHSANAIAITGGALAVGAGVSQMADLAVQGGTLALAPAAQVRTSGFALSPAGTLEIRVRAAAVVTFAQDFPDPGEIRDAGTSVLQGRIRFVLQDGYLPELGERIRFLTSAGSTTTSAATAVDGQPGDGRAFELGIVSDGADFVEATVVEEPPPPPAPLEVSLEDVVVQQQPGDTTAVDLTATLNRTTTTDVDVTVEVSGDGTRFAQAAVGTIKIPAGDTGASVTVDIPNDTAPPITAAIQSVVPSTVDVGEGTATITLTDPPADLGDPSLAPVGFDDTCLVDTDGLGLVKDEPLTAVGVALGAVGCAEPQGVSTVLIGRDDDFADALASGVLQADAPLLLVPRGGPVPPEVEAALADMGPEHVVVLGGVDAVSSAVEEELVALGYAVSRREGPTRLETAVDVAGTDAPAATTAIVARAFAGEGDPSQAFADAIAAGGLAAETGFPVLLTDTASLSAPTAQYLQGSAITDLLVMGGTAAVSDQVVSQLQALVPGEVTRIAGDDRFGTAVEIAKDQGAATAADVSQVFLVEGQADDAWAAGLTAAYASARDDAPILLLNGEAVPPATAAFLTGADGSAGFAVDVADVDGRVVTCAAAAAGCIEARRLLGLDGTTAAFSPAPLSAVDAGEVLSADLGDLPAGADVTYDGSCLAAATADPAELVVDDLAPRPCLLVVTVTYPSGVVQHLTTAYVGEGG